MMAHMLSERGTRQPTVVGNYRCRRRAFAAKESMVLRHFLNIRCLYDAEYSGSLRENLQELTLGHQRFSQ